MKTISPPSRFACLLLGLSVAVSASAVDIANPGFEQGWEGWTDGDPSGSGTAISKKANNGEKSVKLTEKSTYAAQVVSVQPNTTYRLSAFVLGTGNLGAKVGTEIFFEQTPKKSKKWADLTVTFNSGAFSTVTIFGGHAGGTGQFDDFRLELIEDSQAQTSKRVIPSSAGGYGLSPDLPPGKNFDLLDWYLNTPADDDNNGISDRFSEVELANGATDERYFFTAKDGGMVFRATIGGAKTSKNTRFTRTELREMLRRGDKSISTKGEGGDPGLNNWVFSSAPESAQKKAGGVDGTLRATLAVNHVTTTGENRDVGQVVIGQIHASKDEPARLYYQKFPDSQRGSLYVAHEPSGGDDIFVELLGRKTSKPEDPVDGIALDEKFSYEIRAEGNLLMVTISQNDKVLVQKTIDMSASGYDVANDYMYFKAGVYNQNRSGDPEDYVQATFYELENIHAGYDF